MRIDLVSEQLILLANGQYGDVNDPVASCRSLVATMAHVDGDSISAYCLLRHVVGTVVSVVFLCPETCLSLTPAVRELILHLPCLACASNQSEWYEEQICQWWSHLSMLSQSREVMRSLAITQLDAELVQAFRRPSGNGVEEIREADLALA